MNNYFFFFILSLLLTSSDFIAILYNRSNKNYPVAAPMARKRGGPNILITGTPGTGKTHLATHLTAQSGQFIEGVVSTHQHRQNTPRFA